MAIPGYRNGHPYLHSHMLAIKPEFRNSGLGRRLKLAQRDDALRRGIVLIEWTFDPLEIKNAWLNLERLGAICRRYVANQYGITSSPLQGGLPSDRFVAEWWLKSQRVECTLRDGRRPHFEVERRVPLPAGVYEWKADPATRTRAHDLQRRNRELLTRSFAEGLAVLGFERDTDGNGAFLLGKWNEEWEIG
jgi:predicted GNAT superfamily acetyltransferase